MLVNLLKASSSDDEIVYQLMCNSIKPYFEKLWDWDEVHQQKLHKKKFKVSKTRIVEFQEKIVGYLVLSESNTEIYIESLMIDFSFQNIGIGKEVMKNIIQKSTSEKKHIRLQVFKINTVAQRFYQNLGFEKTSESEFNFEMKRYFEISKNAAFKETL